LATYYIATTGNDSTGTGTVGNPWLTIGKAHTSSASGDTVNMAAGTYTWSSSQTFSKNITYVGPTVTSGLPTAIVSASAASVLWYASGFTATFQNVWFKSAGMSDYGIFDFLTTASYWVFTNCAFSDLISTAGANRAIFNNIRSATGATVVCGYTLTNCLVFNCTGASGASANYFSNGHGGMTYTITNCTFYSNVSAATTLHFVSTNQFDSSNGNSTMTLKNNIVWNAATSTAWSGGNTITTYAGSSNDLLGYSSLPTLTSTISSDPLFVDVASNNYNLRPTSPCIDTGVLI